MSSKFIGFDESVFYIVSTRGDVRLALPISGQQRKTGYTRTIPAPALENESWERVLTEKVIVYSPQSILDIEVAESLETEAHGRPLLVWKVRPRVRFDTPAEALLTREKYREQYSSKEGLSISMEAGCMIVDFAGQMDDVFFRSLEASVREHVEPVDESDKKWWRSVYDRLSHLPYPQLYTPATDTHPAVGLSSHKLQQVMRSFRNLFNDIMNDSNFDYGGTVNKALAASRTKFGFEE